MPADGPLVVAFWGGLDDSYLVARFAREGNQVIAVTVDVTGMAPDEMAALSERARALGAARHVITDARRELFDRYLAHLLRGDVRRAGSDPLWSAAEAYLWADALAAAARASGAACAAFCCWEDGAALRLETALQALEPDLELLAPIRDELLTPTEVRACLVDWGQLPGQAARAAGGEPDDYVRASGLWGALARGGELDDPWEVPPDEVHGEGPPPWEAAELPEEFDIEFEEGLPTGSFGAAADPVNLLRQLARIGSRHGVGRLLHLGESPLGLKERKALLVPAATILLTAHRQLEELVLTDRQLLVKDQLALQYAHLFHQGLYREPVMRDLEALFAHSQRSVTGTVRLRIYRGVVEAVGLQSPYALIDPARAGAELWDGRDAEGFARIQALPSILASRAARRRSAASSPPPPAAQPTETD